MTMDSMVNYLTARGFVAEKKYDSSTKSYRFRIGRDGCSLTRYFRYPVGIDNVVRDRIQREFLEEMVKDFNDGISRKIPQSKLNIGTSPISDVINNIFNNLKEKEMGTRRIDWKVESVEVTSDFRNVWSNGTEVHAHLVGRPDPLFSGYVGDIKGDLQNYLNKYKDEDEITKYIANDVDNVYRLANWPKQNPHVNAMSKIKNVIFNDPATIVFWSDGTKTIVKRQNDDVFDPEKGLAMAIVKKMLGNKGNYCNELKKWLPEEKENTPEVIGHVVSAEENENGVIARVHLAATEAAEKLKNALTKGFCSISMEIDEDE